MTKKTKLLVAVLATLMCLSLGLFVACNDETHTHSYTQWAYDDTQHWKVCPDDGAIDESSYGEHVFVAGECECGATQQAEAKEYGTVSGSVTLCTIGEVSSDYTGVTVDLGDDNAVVDFDSATGEFTVENVEVGRTYTLTVSKTGYASYQGGVLLSEEGEEVDLGEVVLESNSAFTTRSVWADWAPTVWGHTSAEEHYFTQGSSITVAVQSVKGYDQVAVTLTVKCSNTTNSEGIWFFFEDGSVCPVSIFADHRIEWDMSTGYKDWGGEGAFAGADNNHFATARDDEWDVIDGDGNHSYTAANISDELKVKHDAGTLELTLVRDGADFYLFIDGKLGEKTTIESEYAEELVYVGFYAKDVIRNSTWQYRIETDISKYIGAANLAIDKTGEGTVSYDTETEYKVGDAVTLALAPANGYHIGSFVIDGTDKTELLAESDGTFTYTYRVDTLAPEIDVTFAQDVVVDATFGITGVKYGVSGNSIADGTTVTLFGKGGMQDFTGMVNSGSVTIEDVVAGIYTISVDGYLTQEITVNEDGSVPDVTLEWDMFEDVVPTTSLGWPAAIYDFTNVNDGEFTFSNTWGIGLLSNENFEGDFAASLLSISGNHTAKEFVVFRFEDGAYVAISSCCDGGNFRLEYLHGDSNLGWGDSNPLVTNIGKKTWDPTNAFGEALYNTGNTSAELAALKAKWEDDGFNLTLVKKGAAIYFFIDDTFIDFFTVDAKYADMSFRFGYYVWNPAEYSVWNYGYTQDVSSYFDDELTLTAAADMENGTVSFDQDSYAAGETATITIEPEQGYILESILIDGHEMIGSVSDNTLKVRVDYSYEVEAVFAAAVKTEVEILVIGNKYGVESNTIADGTKVVLRSELFDDVECEVTDGKIVAELSYFAGSSDITYTAVVEGYSSAAFTVGADGASVTEITLEWDMFEDVVPTTSLGWPAAIYDFTNVNDGEFTFSNTYGIGLLSNENFEGDFAASLLSVSGNHTEKEFVVLRFEDGAYVAISSCCGGGNFRLEYLHGDVSLGWGDNNPLVTNIGRKTWDPTNAFGEALYNTGNTSAELAALKAKWEGDGFNLTLVKKGATICFFIDDTFVDCFTVDAKYADMSFRFGYYVWNPAENSVWNYGYTQDVSSYFDDELTLTAAADMENGTVSFDKDSYSAGETATITINPEQGYILESILVDGHEMIGEVSDNTLEVRVDYSYEVEAVFVQTVE